MTVRRPQKRLPHYRVGFLQFLPFLKPKFAYGRKGPRWLVCFYLIVDYPRPERIGARLELCDQIPQTYVDTLRHPANKLFNLALVF